LSVTCGKVGGFLRVLRLHPPVKLTALIVESGVNHHNP